MSQPPLDLSTMAPPPSRTDSSRSRFVNNIYQNYLAYANKPVVMTLDEFRKYEPIFSKKIRDQLINNELPEEEAERIRQLAEDWGFRVNLRKPVHIVDSQNNELFELPPALMHINQLSSGQEKLLDVIANLTSSDNDFSVGAMKARDALNTLSRVAVENQDPNYIAQQQYEFNKYANSVHQYIGRDINGQPLVQQNQDTQVTKSQPKVVDTDNTQDDDDLCFD